MKYTFGIELNIDLQMQITIQVLQVIRLNSAILTLLVYEQLS
jgi:hypothetical protein